MKKATEVPGMLLPGIEDITRRGFLIWGGSLLVLAPYGCGGSGENGESEARGKVIEHLGGETRIEGNPERVIILDDAMLGYLIPLGVEPVGIAAPTEGSGPGETIYDDFVNYDELEVVAPDYSPNLEQIAAANPDIIFTLDGFETNEELSRISPTIVMNNDFDVERPGFELFVDNFRTIARTLGREGRADETIRDYEERVAEMRERFSEEIENVTVSYATYYPEELRVDGPAGFGGAILADVGFEFPERQLEYMNGPEGEGWRAPFSTERMDLTDADVIISPSSGESATYLDRLRDGSAPASASSETSKPSKTNAFMRCRRTYGFREASSARRTYLTISRRSSAPSARDKNRTSDDVLLCPVNLPPTSHTRGGH